MPDAEITQSSSAKEGFGQGDELSKSILQTFFVISVCSMGPRPPCQLMDQPW